MSYSGQVHVADHSHDRGNLCSSGHASYFALVGDIHWQVMLICFEYCGLVETDGRSMYAHIHEYDV
jgi:hypothetical protein